MPLPQILGRKHFLMLTDHHNRTIDYLRISVIDRCDLRCSYCIPEGFKAFEPQKNWLSFDEIERIVAAFARLGTHRVRLTGGEPLLRKDFPLLASRISAIDGISDLSVTTNGTRLAYLADKLKQSGVHRLNVSLDSSRKQCFEQITGRDSLEKVIAGLKAAKEAGFANIKINMVPLPGQNVDDIEHMIEFCMENNFVLRLIEVMPLGKAAQNISPLDLHSVIENFQHKFDLVLASDILGGGPARYWRSKDGRLTLGLITPLSRHFCATCNRVRLAVDGTLYMCVGQNYAFNLRPLLRESCSDAALEEAILNAVRLKPEKHSFLEKPIQILRTMALTGG